MAVTLMKNTTEELMKLSPMEKLEVADWLREQAREQMAREEPGEGSTVAEATLALRAIQSLDKASQRMVINFIISEVLANG